MSKAQFVQMSKLHSTQCLPAYVPVLRLSPPRSVLSYSQRFISVSFKPGELRRARGKKSDD